MAIDKVQCYFKFLYLKNDNNVSSVKKNKTKWISFHTYYLYIFKKNNSGKYISCLKKKKNTGELIPAIIYSSNRYGYKCDFYFDVNRNYYCYFSGKKLSNTEIKKLLTESNYKLIPVVPLKNKVIKIGQNFFAWINMVQNIMEYLPTAKECVRELANLYSNGTIQNTNDNIYSALKWLKRYRYIIFPDGKIINISRFIESLNNLISNNSKPAWVSAIEAAIKKAKEEKDEGSENSIKKVCNVYAILQKVSADSLLPTEILGEIHSHMIWEKKKTEWTALSSRDFVELLEEYFYDKDRDKKMSERVINFFDTADLLTDEELLNQRVEIYRLYDKYAIDGGATLTEEEKAKLFDDLKKYDFEINEKGELEKDSSFWRDLFTGAESLVRKREKELLLRDSYLTMKIQETYIGTDTTSSDSNMNNIIKYEKGTLLYEHKLNYYKMLVKKYKSDLEDILKNECGGKPILIGEENKGSNIPLTGMYNGMHDYYNDRLTVIKLSGEDIQIEEWYRANIDASIGYPEVRSGRLKSTAAGKYDFIGGTHSSTDYKALNVFKESNINKLKGKIRVGDKEIRLKDFIRDGYNKNILRWRYIRWDYTELDDVKDITGRRKNDINIHKGSGNKTDSKGCLTVFREDYEDFISRFETNKLGKLFIFRFY